MTISATIIADSVSPAGVRLTTMKLVYPRWIHSEVLTHRMFSRNASSSRAIPVNRMLSSILADIPYPRHWGLNESGMQAHREATPSLIAEGKRQWKAAAIAAVDYSRRLSELGFHKQVANRVNEPFQHMAVVCTGTDDAYANFFALRCHPDAEPNIQALAWAMADAFYNNAPRHLEAGLWHLPFILDHEHETVPELQRIHASVARCARASYKNHDGTDPVLEKDLELFERLVKSERPSWEPGHMSPTEHQARALTTDERSGNFHGWLQYRKTLPREYMTFDYADACRRWRGDVA